MHYVENETKDRAIRTAVKTGMKAGSLEGEDVPVPLEAPVVFPMLTIGDNSWMRTRHNFTEINGTYSCSSVTQVFHSS